MAMADAMDLAEMGEQEVAMFAAPAGRQRPGARNAISPFSEIDEQITDAIILLNRLPNSVERQARDGPNRYAQKPQRSQGWVRKQEPELMERADRLAMFMGMGIDPEKDATLRELLQPIEVPRSMFNGIERRLVAGPKRVRQDTPDDGEPSSSMSYSWPARPAVGSRLRPVEIPDADVRGYGLQFQSGLESARPLSGSRLTPGGIFEGGVPDYGYQTPSGFVSGRLLHVSMPRSEGIFESGGLDYGSRAHGNAAATRPPISFGFRPENVLSNGVPIYASRLQSGSAGEEPASNPERRQHDVFEGGTGPSFQNGPTGSRLRGENILDADAAWGVPEHGYHAKHQFSSTGQVLGSDVWLPVPTDNGRNNLRLSGQMVGPKRKAQASPKIPQQETSGAAKVAPIAKAKGEKWKKKFTIDNCPVIVPNGEGFVELRCDVCHCNASAVTGRFWLGARGMQGHLRKIHKEIKSPTEIFARCSVRSVSAGEVKRIGSGELEIEKLFYRTVKDDVQKEGVVGRAQRLGGGEREEGEEHEEEAAPPKRTRKVIVRDISKGKSMKSTTW